MIFDFEILRAGCSKNIHCCFYPKNVRSICSTFLAKTISTLDFHLANNDEQLG